MIARVWRGTTRADQAEAYYEYLQQTGVAACSATAGNAGIEILRHVDGETARFVFVSYWQSMDDVRRFAGADIDRAVYYPDDDAFLLELEPTVSHYDVMLRTPSLETPRLAGHAQGQDVPRRTS